MTFVPLCLFQQFSRFANFWFLICCTSAPPPLPSPTPPPSHPPRAGVLQMIPATSLTNGLPLTSVPLGFVLAISMLREGIEDYARYKSDLEVLQRCRCTVKKCDSLQVNLATAGIASLFADGAPVSAAASTEHSAAGAEMSLVGKTTCVHP